MDKFEILNITMQDPMYQDERDLRNRVLLRPIGIPDFGWEKNDSRSWHFAATKNGKLVGCVVLVRLNEAASKTQLIQMAVEPEFQGRGVGRMLVEHLIEFARKKNAGEIQIHAREDVTPFYLKLGFQVVGEPFEEVGIRHRHMLMRLN